MVRHDKVANIATVDSKITSCQHISSERVVPGPGFITFFPWLSCYYHTRVRMTYTQHLIIIINSYNLILV